MGATAKVLNFEGVEEGSGIRPRRKPEGDYHGHIVDVRDHKAKSGDMMWLFLIKIDGDARAIYPYYVATDNDALWKVRGLFIAAGIKVPPKRLKADPNKLMGKAIGVVLVDDEYEGRMKSAVDAVVPIDDLEDALNEPGKGSSIKAKSRAAEDDDDIEDDDEEDAKPVRNKGKKVKPAPVEDDEDDDDEDEPPAKKAKGKAKPVEDDDDEDDDDDDDEPPAKSKAKKTAKGKGKKKAADDDDDELDLDEL